MSRRISTHKRFPEKDIKYNNLLISLLINRILKHGKKQLAQRIIYKALNFIQFRTTQDPVLIFEKAVRNVSPRVQVKAKRLGGATYQVPVLLNKYKATLLAIKWIIECSKKRTGKSISIKIANELIDAAKGSSNSIKKKEETHKIAEANKAYAQMRY